MGMFDHVVVMDEALRCPHGHCVNDFQTKSFDQPSMFTYLVDGPRVYRVKGLDAFDDAATSHWELEGEEAVFQRRHTAEAVAPPHEVLFYTSCNECTPVLVRRDHAGLWGDLVDERQLWVEFRATFGPAGRHIERTSGTRDELTTELRDDGLRVLRDDEPLAIAHHEVRAARRDTPSRARRPRR